MIRRVHHIDFVVRDLDAAADRYRRLLGIEPRARESLPGRGVELVRFEVGDLWLILVQPTRADSPVQAFLERHGEGFFHIAYQVDDLASEEKRLRREGVTPAAVRRGVEGWKLLDIPATEAAGVTSQLVEEA